MKIDNITPNTASVVLAVTIEGEARKAYTNTQVQRDELATLLPPDLWEELLNTWGDTPTLQEPEPPPFVEPPPDPTQLQIAALEVEVLHGYMAQAELYEQNLRLQDETLMLMMAMTELYEMRGGM